MHNASTYPEEWTIPYALTRAQELSGRADGGYSFLSPDLAETKLTFTALQTEAFRRGRHLLSKGLKKGDTVALVVPSPQDFVLTFLGATAVGIVPVPLYPPLGFGKLDAYLAHTARILRSAGVTHLVTSKKAQHILWSLMDQVDCLTGILLAEDLSGQLPKDAPQPEAVHPDDVAFLQFTSGSTADPKGVIVTHRNLGANGHAIMHEGLQADPLVDKALAWLPLYHDMGLIGFVISPLTIGMDALFMPTMDFIKRPSRWMAAMSRYKVTVSFAPNFAYGLATRRTPVESLKALDLSHVKILGAGAEPNHPGTLNAFLDHFEPAGLPRSALNPVYGMAEATLAMSFRPLHGGIRVDRLDAASMQERGLAIPSADPGAAALEIVGCGLPFSEHAFVIVDPDGKPLPERQVGEIVFRGPSIASGYFDDPDRTASTFQPDGLRTGDMGYLADGEIFITGRKKDLIILNGKNYDPQSIEWPCAELKGVRKGNVVAFSRPGLHSEELVVAAEVKKDANRDQVHNDIQSLVQDTLYLTVSDVLLLDAGRLPKTTSGKLQRAKTRLQYLDGTLGVEGVRTLGDRGQAITLARHVAKSAVSRVKHTLNRNKKSDG